MFSSANQSAIDGFYYLTIKKCDQNLSCRRYFDSGSGIRIDECSLGKPNTDLFGLKEWWGIQLLGILKSSVMIKKEVFQRDGQFNGRENPTVSINDACGLLLPQPSSDFKLRSKIQTSQDATSRLVWELTTETCTIMEPILITWQIVIMDISSQ
jgi:hypothetical protein